ncbi:hypothetical protein, partial [Bacillus atrophaeus]|uniref:hypothetical protein n=1 Tax=Bacillus atrophaeus TaxID=1452 RepID=UPI00227DD327
RLYKIQFDTAKIKVTDFLATGLYSHEDFPYIRIDESDMRMVIKSIKDPSTKLSKAQKSLLELWKFLNSNPDEIAKLMTKTEKERYSLCIEKQRFNKGEYEMKYIPLAIKDKTLVIREEYRLSIFARDYGAGKTLQTFTVLPKEEIQINITTEKEHEVESSSILDSFNQESYSNFRKTLEQQQTNADNVKETQQMSGSASGKTSYGFGSAKGSANFSYGMQATRDTLSESMRSSLESHASEASTKRVITIDTKTEKIKKTNTESVFRKIKNHNESRTLNFVFRQLNQEYVAIKHLVDVRIALWDGVTFKDECSLPELESFLKKHVIDDKIKLVTKGILNNLVFRDYKDKYHCLYEDAIMKPCEGTKEVKYRRFKQCNSIYKKPHNSCDETKDQNIIADGCNDPITVPGFIIGAESYMMKTYGVVVDALLGKNNAIEDNIINIREAELEAKQLENIAKGALIDREKLAQEIIKEINSDGSGLCHKADMYQKIFCCEPVLCDIDDNLDSE